MPSSRPAGALRREAGEALRCTYLLADAPRWVREQGHRGWFHQCVGRQKRGAKTGPPVPLLLGFGFAATPACSDAACAAFRVAVTPPGIPIGIQEPFRGRIQLGTDNLTCRLKRRPSAATFSVRQPALRTFFAASFAFLPASGSWSAAASFVAFRCLFGPLVPRVGRTDSPAVVTDGGAAIAAEGQGPPAKSARAELLALLRGGSGNAGSSGRIELPSVP